MDSDQLVNVLLSVLGEKIPVFSLGSILGDKIWKQLTVCLNFCIFN